MSKSTAVETFYHVVGARVIWKNRERFLKYTSFSLTEPDSIDEWFLSNLAVVSGPCLESNVVATTPATDGRSRNGVRPPTYGRAAVFSTSIGTFDVKGVGVRSGTAPRLTPYGTGLINVVDATFELVREMHVVEAVGPAAERLSTLALILLPFLMRDVNGSGAEIPCALLVREFAPRPSWWQQQLISPDAACEATIRCELELRKHGMTSCHPRRRIYAAGRASGLVRLKSKLTFPEKQLSRAVRAAHRKECIELPATLDVANVEFGITNTKLGGPRLSLVDFGAFRTEWVFQEPFIAYIAAERFYFSIMSPKHKLYVHRAAKPHHHAHLYDDSARVDLDLFGGNFEAGSAVEGYVRIAEFFMENISNPDLSGKFMRFISPLVAGAP